MAANQRGFTLIELMIVVAIIGILASVAMPAYHEYTGRAQASEGLTATARVRADMSTHLSDEGALPGPGDSLYLDTVLAQLEGNYFVAGGATLASAGVIQIDFSSGVHSGESMTLTAVESAAGGQIARWDCGGLELRYLPKACHP